MYGLIRISIGQFPADLLPYDIILGTVNRQSGVGAIWRNVTAICDHRLRFRHEVKFFNTVLLTSVSTASSHCPRKSPSVQRP